MNSINSASSKSSKSDSSLRMAVIGSMLFTLFSSVIPGAIEKSHALDLWQYSHYVNTVSSLIIFIVMTVIPPAFLQGSQAARYGQLTAIGFLTVAIQSYHCTSAMRTESMFLTESAIVGTIVVVMYNLSFYTLTWPARIAENSPAISGAEKFFASLAVVTSIGMVPALVLELVREPLERFLLIGCISD